MRKPWIVAATLLVTLLVYLGITSASPFKTVDKINGVSLVAPPNPMDEADLATVLQVNAGWVAVIPFGFSQAGNPNLSYDHNHQWWGERKEGTLKQISMAHDLNLKVMLKPHVWVRGHGWPGDYQLDSEEDWQIWENDYRTFMMDYAQLAQESATDMLCIGTEFRYAVRERPEFWKSLIVDIRKIYDGHLTYAANWDNYDNVTFWDQLDYIGIDAYYPLIKELENPSDETLDAGWKPIIADLKRLHEQHNKPVLFTEYGFRSIDFCAAGHYNIPEDQIRPNERAQAAAYASLYRTLWQEPWFAGGFLWKWFTTEGRRPDARSVGFTPQGKEAEAVIARYYQPSGEH